MQGFVLSDKRPDFHEVEPCIRHTQELQRIRPIKHQEVCGQESNLRNCSDAAVYLDNLVHLVTLSFEDKHRSYGRRNVQHHLAAAQSDKQYHYGGDKVGKGELELGKVHAYMLYHRSPPMQSAPKAAPAANTRARSLSTA